MPSLWITGEDEALVPLESSGYASEADFQALLAEKPEVLATALDKSGEASRWLLIDRELSIKGEFEGDTIKWSLDHLFLDADATPTLVEVKRSSDPRARREVVGQMLDYAASFALDWTADRLRDRWEKRLAQAQLDRDSEMELFLDTSRFEDEEHFWSEVQTRIAASKLRLLFVADQLSPAVIRIIEYLNAQLTTTEMLGVEVLRHTGGDPEVVAYEPVVRGISTPATRTKSRGKPPTREELEASLLEHHGPEMLAAVEDLVARAEKLGAWVSIGPGASKPRLFLRFRTASPGRAYRPIGVNPKLGRVVLPLRDLRHQPAFADESVRADYIDRVAKAIGSPVTGEDKVGGFPWFPVGRLTSPGVLDGLVEVLKWVVATADAPQSIQGDGGHA